MNDSDTKTAYTPGPWVINSLYAKVSDVLTVHAPNTNNAQICSLAAMRGHMDESEQTSNARLIAAAPSMLEALKQAAFAIPTTHGAFDSVNRAIKLAIGQ